MTGGFLKKLLDEKRQGQASHIMVNAGAGTGKTFTEVLSVAWCYRDKVWHHVEDFFGGKITPSEQQAAIWEKVAEEVPHRVIYLAFNNSIVKEFEEKWSWLTRLLEMCRCEMKFQTIHSMGWRATARQYKLSFKDIWKRTTEDNLAIILDMDVRELRKNNVLRETLTAVNELVSKCKLNLVEGVGEALQGQWGGPENKQLYQLAVHYSIELPEGREEQCFGYVRDCLRMAGDREGTRQVNFDDQIWLPVINEIPLPRADLLLVDESQDLNRCQQELVLKAGDRLLMCGDVHQAIYGFAGADTESMNRMAKRLKDTDRGLTTLPLNMTRRCGKRIVARAQQIVAEFYAHEDNPEGEILEMSAAKAFKEYQPEDLVVCRTNAPPMGTAFKMMKQKRPVRVQGRAQLYEVLLSLVKKSEAQSIEALVDWLERWRQREVDKINKYKSPDEDAIIAVVDKADTIIACAVECEDVEELKRMLSEVFDFKGPATLFSSIHRAKGLEADRVFILKPELLPHPLARTNWAKEQERNLEYVAITRAAKTLVLVHGDK